MRLRISQRGIFRNYGAKAEGITILGISNDVVESHTHTVDNKLSMGGVYILVI